MSTQGAGTAPRCIPIEILTDVVRDRAIQAGEVVRSLRVFTKVKEVDRCHAELIQARVEARDDAWDVTALLRIAVRVDTEHGDRQLRTIAFYRGRIPFPVEGDWHGHHHHMEALVKIRDLECNAGVDPDCKVVVVTVTFLVAVYALEDEIITVCRLHEPR